MGRPGVPQLATGLPANVDTSATDLQNQYRESALVQQEDVHSYIRESTQSLSKQL